MPASCRRAPATPAASAPRLEADASTRVGTLEPGVTADVAVLELKDGPFEFNDGARQTRSLKQQFAAVATVKGGIFLKGAPAVAGGRGVAPGPAPVR